MISARALLLAPLAVASVLLPSAAASVLQAPAPHRLALHGCSVVGVAARCGTLDVPENRFNPGAGEIGLSVVVIPAAKRPARPDAFVYLPGGPGVPATAQASFVLSLWGAVHARHDIVLVDQRGTGDSNPLDCPRPPFNMTKRTYIPYLQACLLAAVGDPTQYGTLAAAQDLEAVRLALGYRSLDLYGASYGATLAQAFLIRFPHSVRTIVLDGATLVDIPFFSRYASNGRLALDAVQARCDDEPACVKAYPNWRGQLEGLMRAWDRHPKSLPQPLGGRITGYALAGVVQSLTLSVEGAAVVPYVVSRAARGDLHPLADDVSTIGFSRSLMFWTIWCNEPWVGLNSGTAQRSYLDGYLSETLATDRFVCSKLPAWDAPEAEWRLPARSGVPVLAFVGGADPQDPLGNLTGLRRHFPNSRIVVVPGMGHTVGQYGCLGALTAQFIARGGALGLDTDCARQILPRHFFVG